VHELTHGLALTWICFTWAHMSRHTPAAILLMYQYMKASA